MPDDEEDGVDEITPENIKKLAKQAGGGDDDGDNGSDDSSESSSRTGGGGGGGSSNVDMEVERVKSNIDMLKEQNDSAMDRIQSISQNIGEMRQKLNDQERAVSTFEADIDKLQDAIEEIEPSEYEKKLNELQAATDSNQADINRVGEKVDRALQIANDVQETLNNLGSMDNLIEMNKEFEEKLSEIKEAERYIERLASKSEKINIRINKKMNEYNTYKAMVDTLQEKTSDMFQKLDEVSLEVEDAVTEDEMEKMRERIHEMEEQVETYSNIAPLAEMSLPQPIVELREKRKDIEEFLEELEEQYSSGKLSTSEYQKIKEANEEKLEKVNKKLVHHWNNLEEIAQSDETPEMEETDTDIEEEEAGEPDEGSDEESDDEGDSEEASGEDSGEEGGEEDEAENQLKKEMSPERYELYQELLEKSVSDVKEIFSEKNLDAQHLLELERQGKNRNTLVEWLASKAGE